MTAPISALAAARFFCEASGWRLTNLQLQKMLYLAQMQYMGETKGDRLMDETFEAWDYGPVSPQVYHEVKPFGKEPIPDVFYGVSRVADEELRATLAGYYNTLARYSPSRLVSITHWDQGAWAKNYRPGVRGLPITDADILDEYRARLADIKARREQGAVGA